MRRRDAPLFAIIPPPVVYAATFLVGLMIGWLIPCTPDWIRAVAVHWFGWMLLIAGFLLGPGSAGLFVVRRTTLNPTGAPRRLVTAGAFALTRNPMCLGLSVIYLGLALVLARICALLLLPVPWAVINWMVIPFEEARLKATFGQPYEDYCRRVRRWI
jgi:protein-S-isoprenylcysteine O-methyltransferase Ste14